MEARNRMLAGLPLGERRIELAGAETAVLEGGAGAPLILLHGGIECGGAYWAPVVPALAERHRLVVPDVPGLGESEPVERLGEIFDDWLAALIDLIGPPKPDLVAHSLVGTLAARFATRHGERLRRLVVYGTPGIGPYRMPLGLRAIAIRYDLRPSLANLQRFERWAFLDRERVGRSDPEWFDAFEAYLLACSKRPGAKRTMRRLIGVGTKRVPDAELERIGVPVAVLNGRHDRMVALELSANAALTLEWPLHVVEDSGHVPHMERPDDFCAALRAALEAPNRKGVAA